MKGLPNLVILLSLFLFFCEYSWAEKCSVPMGISFLSLADGAQYTQIDLAPDWQNETPLISPALDFFKQKISDSTSTDTIYLLTRQRDIMSKFDKKIASGMSQVIDGKVGRIYNSGCLETSLLDAILKKYPDNDKIEYLALVLKRDTLKGAEFKAHILTWGLIHVPPSSEFMKLVDADIKSGWQLFINLHNHPFYLDNLNTAPGDIGGAVYPSAGDFALYKNHKNDYHLEQAWVTNGFGTLKLNNSEF